MSTQILLKGSYNNDSSILEVGIDEAGRGALAGPVTVSAVIMPHGFSHPLIKDSKLLNESQRKEAREIVIETAIAYSVVHIDINQIENTNILRATLKGMNDSLFELNKNSNDFDFILVDGDQFHGYEGIPFKTIVGGDNKYTSIAAASILAKTHRDAIMLKLDKDFPQYYWKKNKGYPTKKHRQAILENGITKYHRKTFQLVPVQYEIEF